MGWRRYPLIDERSEPDAFAPRSQDVQSREGATLQPSATLAPAEYAYNDGEKFFGGFGVTQLLTADYWTLRARSAQLFETNLYARGLVRRLVTNVIHVGLFPEAAPEESVLGYPKRGLAEWCEDVETRFGLWASDPWLCDHLEQRTYGQLLAEAYREALISGDVLVVLRQSKQTGLPRVQLISGAKVRTPWPRPKTLARIEHGVELDANGRHVAYWVDQEDGTSKRLPAWGEKSGRRLAWLFYATDKRLDDVRGQPLLTLMLQALRELDRYRDATLRKAVINSMLAMFIKRSLPEPASMPIGGGAIRRGTAIATTENGSAATRRFAIADMLPGLALQELAPGEEPQAFAASSASEGYGDFESAVVATVAWVYEVPPEILRLTFGTNYAASQASINEFKLVLTKIRTDVGASVCQPIYVEWLIASAVSKKIAAPGLVEAWRDTSKWDLFAAWTGVDWAGAIKPAVDMSKLVKGYAALIEQGLITRARACRELTGMKYSKVVQQLTIENSELADAQRVLQAVVTDARTIPQDDKPIDENGNLPEDPEHQNGEDSPDGGEE